MANPTKRKSHQIDLLRHNGSAYEIVCGITSFDLNLTRPARTIMQRDCGTNFAEPTRSRVPGIPDCSFSGSGVLDIDYRQEFKSTFESATSTLFKVAIEGMGTFVGNFCITQLQFQSDAADENGFIQVSLSLELDGALTWAND